MGLAKHAFRSQVGISVDNGASFSYVSWLTGVSLNTSASTTSTRTFEDGILDPQDLDSITPTLSMSMKHDDLDTAQKALLESLIANPASFMVRIRATVTSGDYEYIGRAFVSGGNLFDSQLGGHIERSFDLGFKTFGMQIQQ